MSHTSLERDGVTRGWHAALAALIAVAVVWQTVLVVRDDASVVNLFSYFTIQSNLLMMVGAAGVAARRDGPVFAAVRLAGLVGITVTGIVYVTVLAGKLDQTGAAAALNVVFHYIVPAASVIGFVLIAPRTSLHRSSWWFLAWPIAWLAYTLVRAEIASPAFLVSDSATAPVPYGFLDVDANGAGSVALACIGVTLATVAIAAFYQRLGGVRRS